MSRSKAEDLPNEILQLLFGYLDGFHLILAFGKLNSRFKGLIHQMYQYDILSTNQFRLSFRQYFFYRRAVSFL